MASATLRWSQLVLLTFLCSFLPQGESCGGNFTSRTGTIKSPNYPSYYSHSIYCTWYIIGPDPSSRVTLIFSRIQLENHASGTNSCFDYLRITSVDENDQLVDYEGFFCGSYSDLNIVSHSRILKVIFTTDSSVSKEGFIGNFTISNYYTPSTTTSRPCLQDEITCPNGRCISPENLCDGVDDCLDYWDEDCWRASWNKTGVEPYLTRGLLSQLKSEGSDGKEVAQILSTIQMVSSRKHAFPSKPNSNWTILASKFEAQLSTAFLQNNTVLTKGSGFSFSIIALKAICQDPQDFHGLNLTARLYSANFSDAGPFTSLALCVADLDLPEDHILNLIQIALKNPQNIFDIDRKATAILALVCAHRRGQVIPRVNLTSLALELAALQDPDTGSFGGLHSSALVGQALLSLKSDFPVKWKYFKLIDYLKSQEKSNGGFGRPDIETTALVLPVLAGRSYLDLVNTSCPSVSPLSRTPKVGAGPMLSITFSIWYKDSRQFNLTHEYQIPATFNATFFDLFKLFLRPKFRSEWEMLPWGPSISFFNKIYNDPQEQIYWRLFLFLNDRIPQRVHKRLDQVYLQDGAHYVLWYTSAIQ